LISIGRYITHRSHQEESSSLLHFFIQQNKIKCLLLHSNSQSNIVIVFKGDKFSGNAKEVMLLSSTQTRSYDQKSSNKTILSYFSTRCLETISLSHAHSATLSPSPYLHEIMDKIVTEFDMIIAVTSAA